jgi:heat shock protein HtpX
MSGNRRDGKAGAILMIISIVAAILAPLVAQMVSLAISRKREFTADATAVKLTRYSPGLKRALEKIKHEHLREEDKKKYPKAVAPLFISDPFKSKISGLFATHPPIDERIRRLEKM